MARELRKVFRAKIQRALAEVATAERRDLESALRAELASLRAEHEAGRNELRDEMRAHLDEVLREVRAVEVRDRRDLIAAGERLAAGSSARLIMQSMTGARQFPYPDQTLKYALSIAPESGMALEFGVYKGTTLRLISEVRRGQDVYGFDSFEGLPENWRAGFLAGTFDDLDAPPDVAGAKLVVGWFADTLPEFLADHEGDVALLHVDSDLYSSAVTVLEHVGPRLKAGSVIIFDEFFNYPGWEDGEYRAWQEFVARTGCEYTYEAYTLDNEQVVVRLT